MEVSRHEGETGDTNKDLDKTGMVIEIGLYEIGPPCLARLRNIRGVHVENRFRTVPIPNNVKSVPTLDIHGKQPTMPCVKEGKPHYPPVRRLGNSVVLKTPSPLASAGGNTTAESLVQGNKNRPRGVRNGSERVFQNLKSAIELRLGVWSKEKPMPQALVLFLIL